MSEMVERVALAIQDEFGPTYGHLAPLWRCRETAIAAIKAMREPTSEMEEEACWHLDTRAIDVWQSMIDEALK